MSDDVVKQFPPRPSFSPLGGVPARTATFDSELDPCNPNTDSLRGMLLERRALIERYTSSDGSVWDIERKIAERVAALAGDL
jgi:hypothetical protein